MVVKMNQEAEALLRGILDRLNSNVMTERFESLRPEVKVRVGFLGEWNSGKSTLLNALLGRKVLPVLPTPTTGAITEIEPSSQVQELEFYELDPEGKEIEIDANTFSELATGKRKGKALVRVPVQGVFAEGFRFIDTPGTQSLNEIHTDITFGYLPFLDGIVVCHDLGRGELPKTVIDFLSQPDVRPLLSRVLLTLTCADRKDHEGRRATVAAVEAQLRQFQNNFGGVIPQVVAVSALKVLEGDPEWTLDEFQEAFRRTFLEPRYIMEEKRYHKALVEFARELLSALEAAQRALTLDDSEIQAEEKQLKAKKAELEYLQQQEKDRLERLHEQLRRILTHVANDYISKLKDAKEDTIEAVAEEFARALIEETTSTCKRLGHDIELSERVVHVGELVSRIKKVYEVIDPVVTVATAITTAIVAPGTGVLANLAEGAAGATAGAAARRLSIDDKRSGSLFRAIGGFFGKLIQSINPFEYLGKMACSYLVKGRVEDMVPQMAIRLADQVCWMIEEELEEKVFKPTIRQIFAYNEALRLVNKKRQQAIDTLEKQRISLSNDIRSLTNWLKKASNESLG